MFRKGSVPVYIAISIMILSLLLANIFSKINSNIFLSSLNSEIIQDNILTENIIEQSMAYLETNDITTELSTSFEGATVKFMPLKLENPLVPDYNDPEFSALPTRVDYFGKMDLKVEKSYDVQEYRDYLLYIENGEIKLFANGTYNLGNSENGFFVLKRPVVMYYGLGLYNFVDFKGTNGYIIGLAEWNPYKFNGIYKIEVNGLEIMVHKAGNTVYQLLKNNER